MTVADHVPLGDVKNRLSEYVDRIEREHERVVITKHGRPAAVVISVDDLEALEETLAVLCDSQAMQDLVASRYDLLTGTTSALTKDEALALIRRD